MSNLNLRSTSSVYLVGEPNHQITGCKLPSNRQVLQVLFYNSREVKLLIKQSANLVIRECVIFWEKARIPLRAIPNCVKKLENLHETWKNLQKHAHRTSATHKQQEDDFTGNLDNLFDIAHANALELIKIEEDKLFLQCQRQPGRPGSLIGVDKNLAEKERRQAIRDEEEKQRKLKHLETSTSATASCSSQNVVESEFNDHESFISTENDKNTDDTEFVANIRTEPSKKNFITPELVAALDQCRLSIRDSVFVIGAVAEALGHNIDQLSISKSSIQRIRTSEREKRAKVIKQNFQNQVPDVVTVHWDGKLLPGLDQRCSKEERLPILITFEGKEQLLAVPKLENSTGEAQSTAVLNALMDWNLDEKVQILYCDTTASNTGRFNGACVRLEQELERDLLLFACCHHVYELLLKAAFEAKLPQVTKSPDIPLFKKFRDSWKNINPQNFQVDQEILTRCEVLEIQTLSTFYHGELEKKP
ncbi:uncharacterized protein LOC135847444 [Planococcus citri]|uniref:uncharacterized protein LOC135847444 n=1 Tax=Planococcus citri TaxID=170843 RepID=UPI0031F9BA06